LFILTCIISILFAISGNYLIEKFSLEQKLIIIIPKKRKNKKASLTSSKAITSNCIQQLLTLLALTKKKIPLNTKRKANIAR
jgi:hypothetical protein